MYLVLPLLLNVQVNTMRPSDTEAQGSSVSDSVSSISESSEEGSGSGPMLERRGLGLGIRARARMHVPGGKTWYWYLLLLIPHRLPVRGFCAAPATLCPRMPRCPWGRRVALVVNYAPYRSLDGVPTGPLLVSTWISLHVCLFRPWPMRGFSKVLISQIMRSLKAWSSTPTSWNQAGVLYWMRHYPTSMMVKHLHRLHVMMWRLARSGWKWPKISQFFGDVTDHFFSN